MEKQEIQGLSPNSTENISLKTLISKPHIGIVFKIYFIITTITFKCTVCTEDTILYRGDLDMYKIMNEDNLLT